MADYLADTLSNLIEPDVMLPSQFFSTEEAGVRGGERKLMAALLSDGIEAYIAQATVPKVKRRANAYDACEWVDTRDHSYVFSFDVVCESLGINPEYLRLGLNRYVEAACGSSKDTNGEPRVPVLAWKKIRRPRK